MFRKFTNAAKVGTKGWLEAMGGPQRTTFEDETVHSILQLLVESCVMEEMGSTTGGGRSLGSLHDERRAILRRLWDLVQDTPSTLGEEDTTSHSPFTDNQLASSEDALEKLMLAMSLLQRLWDDVSQRGNNNNTMHKLLTEECLLILSIIACVVAPNHDAVCGRILAVLPDANIICWLLTAVPNPDVCRMAAKLFSDLCVCDPQTMAVLLQRSQNAVDRVVAFLTRCEREESDEQSLVSRDSCSCILSALADVLAADAASLLVNEDADDTTVSIPSMLMFGGVCDELLRIIKQQSQPNTMGLLSLRIIHLILAGSTQATSLFVQMGLLAHIGQLTFRVPAPTTTTPLPPFLRATKDDSTATPTTAEAILSLAATITMDCLRTCSQLDEEQRRDLPSTSTGGGGDTSGFMKSGASTQRWALTRSAREHLTNQSCIGRNVLRFISLCTPLLLHTTAHPPPPICPLGGLGGLVPFIATLVEILLWMGEAGDEALRKFSCDWISATDGVALNSELDMENGSSAYISSMVGLPRYTATEAIIGLISTSNNTTIPDAMRTLCCRLSGSLLQGAPDGWGLPLLGYILSHPPTIPTVSRPHLSRLILQLVGTSLSTTTSAGGVEGKLDTIRPWIKDLFTPSLLGRDGWRAVLESAPCPPIALLVCSEVYIQVIRDNAGFSNAAFAEVLLGKCMVAIRTTFEGDGSHANRSTDAVVAWLLLAQISVHREVLDPEGTLRKAIDSGTLHCRYLSWGGSNPNLPTISSGRHDLRSDSQQASSPSPRRGGTLKAVMGAFASHELLTIISNEYSDEVASLLTDPLPLQAVTSYCEANSQDPSVGVWMRPANVLVQAMFRVGRGAARQGALWVPRDIWEAFYLEAKARNVPRAASPSVAVDLRAQIAALTARNHALEEALRKHESIAATQRKRLRVLLPRFEPSALAPPQEGGPH